jgi:hypothetical protein
MISVDGQKVADHALPRTLPFTFAWDETLDVGLDTGTPVDDRDYQVPFAFTGRSNRTTVDIGETSATPKDLAGNASARAAARLTPANLGRADEVIE